MSSFLGVGGGERSDKYKGEMTDTNTVVQVSYGKKGGGHDRCD